MVSYGFRFISNSFPPNYCFRCGSKRHIYACHARFTRSIRSKWWKSFDALIKNTAQKELERSEGWLSSMAFNHYREEEWEEKKNREKIIEKIAKPFCHTDDAMAINRQVQNEKSNASIILFIPFINYYLFDYGCHNTWDREKLGWHWQRIWGGSSFGSPNKKILLVWNQTLIRRALVWETFYHPSQTYAGRKRIVWWTYICDGFVVREFETDASTLCHVGRVNVQMKTLAMKMH